MYQERFQRSLDIFHQLIVKIRPVSVFYQSPQGCQCNNSHFLQSEERFLSEIQLNSSIAGNPQVYLEPSRTSTMEPFCEKGAFLLKAVNYFRRKAALQMFDWVLNKPLEPPYILT